jgi:hypothetical protein
VASGGVVGDTSCCQKRVIALSGPTAAAGAAPLLLLDGTADAGARTSAAAAIALAAATGDADAAAAARALAAAQITLRDTTVSLSSSSSSFLALRALCVSAVRTRSSTSVAIGSASAARASDGTDATSALSSSRNALGAYVDSCSSSARASTCHMRVCYITHGSATPPHDHRNPRPRTCSAQCTSRQTPWTS